MHVTIADKFLNPKLQKRRVTAYMAGMSPMPEPPERKSRRLKRLSGMFCFTAMMPLE